MKKLYPDPLELDKLAVMDSAAQIEVLAEWDAAGFLLEADEESAVFAARVKRILAWRENFLRQLKQQNKVEFAPKLYAEKNNLVPLAIIQEAAEKAEALYAFNLQWAPACFLTEPLGMLWGGSSWADLESGETMCIIRKEFRKKSKWYVYERKELLAHELCHLAHAPVSGNGLEEFFAYRTSAGKLRRYLGNCFVYNWDALFFMLPSMLLLGAELLNFFWRPILPLWPFWVLTVMGPGWLIWRNQRWRNYYFKAEKWLKKFNLPAEKILFRCTEMEIQQIAEIESAEKFKSFVQQKCAKSIRFQVIKRRFITEQEP